MEIACPNCGSPGQFAGKYCESCGYLIPADAGTGGPSVPSTGGGSSPGAAPAGVGAGQSPVTITGGTAQASGSSPVVGAQFAVVRDGAASLNEGFAITKTGEFLVGRMDQETGHQVDVDLRQWVQPVDVGGQKQYLVHRKQCYLGVADGGTVIIRSCPGGEADTLVKGAGESTFTSLQNLGEKRQARQDGSYELELHDQIFMGDPEAVMYFLSGDPTAQGNYIVLELINKS